MTTWAFGQSQSGVGVGKSAKNNSATKLRTLPSHTPLVIGWPDFLSTNRDQLLRAIEDLKSFKEFRTKNY